MKKKILRAALAVLLVCALVFCFASCATTKVADADSAEGKIDGTEIEWEYDADDKTLSIDGTGAIPNFETSEDVAWYAVRHSVEEIKISEGITSIGDYAFYYCPALEEIKIPATVTYIGNYAFAFCSSLEGIELPDALTVLGEGCFEACISLKGINVPATVNSIGARAFAHCSSLEDAVIMAQINKIESWTFMGCTSLEKLLFNESARAIEVAADAFEDAEIDFEDATFTADNTGKLTLTINYIYEDGSTAEASYVETFDMGSSYSVVSPAIENYEASELTVSGVISGDETINVTYSSVVEETEAETEAETEPTEDVEAEEDKGVDVGTIIAIVIFAVVIIAIVVLVIVMIHSDKKQNGNTTKRK